MSQVAIGKTSTGLRQPVQVDPSGALILSNGSSAVSPTNGVPIVDAYAAPVVAAWSSATAVNTALQVNTQGMDTVIVTLVTGGLHSGGSVAFEVYDGAAWIPVRSASVSDYTTTSTTSLSANMTKGYQIPVAGFPSYRSRLTAAPTSGILTITTVVSSAPDTSIVTVGNDPAQIPNQYSYSCPATVTAQGVKSTAGTVSHMVLTNTAASMRFVRLYNAAPGNVTVASTAANYVIGLQANQTLDVSCGYGGLYFSTAITLAVSGAKGLADATAVTAGDVMISLAYV
jgi:hypothetical protein